MAERLPASCSACRSVCVCVCSSQGREEKKKTISRLTSATRSRETPTARNTECVSEMKYCQEEEKCVETERRKGSEGEAERKERVYIWLQCNTVNTRRQVISQLVSKAVSLDHRGVISV